MGALGLHQLDAPASGRDCKGRGALGFPDQGRGAPGPVDLKRERLGLVDLETARARQEANARCGHKVKLQFSSAFFGGSGGKGAMGTPSSTRSRTSPGVAWP